MSLDKIGTERSLELTRDCISIDNLLSSLTAKNINWCVVMCEPLTNIVITDLIVVAGPGDLIEIPPAGAVKVIQKLDSGIFANNNLYKVASNNAFAKCVIVCSRSVDNIPSSILNSDSGKYYTFSRSSNCYIEADKVMLEYIEADSVLASATREEVVPHKVKLRTSEQISISPLVDYILEDMSDTIKVLGGTEDSEKRSYLIRKLSNLANDLEKIVL